MSSRISMGWESLFEPGSHEAKPGKPISYDEEFVIDEEVIKALEEIEYIEASQEHSANAITTGNNQPGINPRLNRNVFTAHPNRKQPLTGDTRENPSISQVGCWCVGRLGKK